MIDLETPPRRRTQKGRCGSRSPACWPPQPSSRSPRGDPRRRDPADQPSPTVTVPPTCLRDRCPTRGGELEPGTYYVDEVNGTPTPRIFATLDAGCGRTIRGRAVGAHEVRHRPHDVQPSRRRVLRRLPPDRWVHPGPVATVDGLVTALREQQGGWVDVTAPSDISVDGYVGKAFQRTAPAVMSDCDTDTSATEAKIPQVRRFSELGDPRRNQRRATHRARSRPCGSSTSTARSSSSARNLWPGPSATAHADFADDVLDSIRIDRP